MPLDASIILGSRPLPTPGELRDQQQARELRQQEVELRRQEILARRDALREQAAARNRPKEPTAAERKAALEYGVFKAEVVTDRLKRARENPSIYPYTRRWIADNVGEASELPEEFDPQALDAIIAFGEKHIEDQKGTLQRIETTDAEGNPVQRFVVPREGDSYPSRPAAPAAPPRPVPIETVDERGRRVTRFVIPKEGEAFPKPAQASPSSAALAAGGLDADGLDLAATRFRVTGTLPARDSRQNAAIMNAAAKQAKDLGLSPAATIQKQAAYKGDAAALQDITKRAASAEAFEAKAMGQIPIIQELSAKVPRTSMPIINAALQSGRTEITGDSNATQLANAIETFTEEYAKIMGGSTGSAAGATDSSRAAAKRLLNTAMSKGTMNDVLALMQREMSLTMQGYDATKQHITERMGGGVPPSAPVRRPIPSIPGGVAESTDGGKTWKRVQ